MQSPEISISVAGMYRIMLRADKTIMPIDYLGVGNFPARFQPYIIESQEESRGTTEQLSG